MDKENPGSYHIYVRGLRKSFFFDNEEIKVLFEERIAHLLQFFLIQMTTFALLDNHLHLILHNRPDIAEDLSPQEVLRRARGAFPSFFVEEGIKPEEEIPEAMYECTEIVEEFRQRMSDISWFMHRLNGYMANEINAIRKEEGPVFETFKSQRLTDAFALIAACMYVDLNIVRAKIANLPEESRHCGIWYRIRAFQSLQQTGQVAPEALLVHMLRPIHCEGDFPEPPADGEQELTEEQRAIQKRLRVGPLENMPVEAYIAMVDQHGRDERPDKRGKIPSEVAEILERIGATPEQLMETVEAFPQLKSAVGKAESIRAEAQRRGVRSLQGVGIIERIFRNSTEEARETSESNQDATS